MSLREARKISREAAGKPGGIAATGRPGFETAEDAYRFESERNRKYEVLINVMRSERDVSSTILKLMARSISQSRVLRTQAEFAAQKGNFAEAAGTMEKANVHLTRVLQFMGPQTSPASSVSRAAAPQSNQGEP